MRVHAGFGFGPIQSALFLFEAFRSGNFGRYAVAEVDAALVDAVRSNGGRYTINIAHPDRIEQVEVSGVELYNPTVAEDREKFIEVLKVADEITTALPSVKFFTTGGETSVVEVLAAGIRRRDPAKPAIVYTAENHNHAAEILTEELQKRLPTATLKNIQALNTVVGKMSGVITDAPTIERLKLAPLTPRTPRAVLVEAFNRILVTRVTVPYTRGIPVFPEKADLLPFEEAKLYGHNAIHALIGYLSQARGLTAMSDAAAHPDILATARAAFLEESGAALTRKYASLGDPLFTPDGYRAYVEDLLVRMMNPNLYDLVARVIRDPARKLGWDDRLFGTMRLALAQGITPRHMARGAAAAVRFLLGSKSEPATVITGSLDRSKLATLLAKIWGSDGGVEGAKLVDLTWEAYQKDYAK